MNIEYALIDDDAWVPQYRDTYPSITEAAAHRWLGSYIVAIENGKLRALNIDEEMELLCTIGIEAWPGPPISERP